MRYILLSILLVFLPAYATAKPATPGEAKLIAQGLHDYLGDWSQYVAVIPDGEVYQVLIDVNRACHDVCNERVFPDLSQLRLPGLHLQLNNSDGQSWQIVMNQSFRVYQGDERRSTLIDVPQITLMARYNTDLNSFSYGKVEIADVHFHLAAGDKKEFSSSLNYRVADIEFSVTSEPNDNQHINSDYKFKTGEQSLSTVITSHGGKLVETNFSASRAFMAHLSFVGLRHDILDKFWRWHIAHRQEVRDGLIDPQSGFEQFWQAGLPLFDEMFFELDSYDREDDTAIKMEENKPSVSRHSINKVAKKSIRVGLKGWRHAAASFFYSAGGIKFYSPELLNPTPLQDLVVSDAKFTVEVANLDLDHSAPILFAQDFLRILRTINPRNWLGDEQIMTVLTSVLTPKNEVNVRQAGFELVAPAFKLEGSGQFNFNPNKAQAIDQLRYKVSMSGLDEVIATLKPFIGKTEFVFIFGTPMPLAMTLPRLETFRSIGKLDIQKNVSWDVKTSKQGAILINGTDVRQLDLR